MTTDALNHFFRKRLDILNIFAQNIDCNGYQQSCLGSKIIIIIKLLTPVYLPVSLYKSGVQGGIHNTDIKLFPDE